MTSALRHPIRHVHKQLHVVTKAKPELCCSESEIDLFGARRATT
jgi:hypothetical protein